MAPSMRLLPLLLPSLLLAQAPGPAPRSGVRFSTSLGAELSFQVWVRNQALPAGWAQGDADLHRVWEEEVQLERPPQAQLEALWSREGWNPTEPRLVLVDALGRKVAAWADLPTPALVREAMRNAGWSPRLERLEAFIRQHPDQGEAQAQRISLLLGRLTRLDPERDAEATAAAAEALQDGLRRLRAFEDWPYRTPVGSWGMVLGHLGRRKDPPLPVDLSRALRADIASALLRAPFERGLWNAWGNLAEEPADLDALLDRLVPLPGEPPLPGVALQPVLGFLIRINAGPALGPLCERMLSASPAFTPPAQAQWRAGRVAALFLQDRREEAHRQLQADVELQPEVAFAVPGLLGMPGSPMPLTGEDRKRISALLGNRGPRRPSPAPERPVLRLEVGGSPIWAKAAAALATHPAFDDWGEGELTWGTLNEATWRDLRTRLGWGPEGRWILHRGDEVLASGTELPEPGALADRVREGGLPALAALRGLLRRQPDHVAALRRRSRLLLTRMPHPRLEVLLLADALRLQEPFLDSAERSAALQRPLWEGAARRILPELEAGVQRWPEDEEAWLTWLDWSHLAGRGEAPELLGRLERMPSGSPPSGPLSLGLGAAVAERLKAQGRSRELAAWGRPFWEALLPLLPAWVERAQGHGRSSPPGNLEDRSRWLAGQEASGRLRETQTLLRPWVEALQGREAEGIRQALDAVEPGLARRLLGSPDGKPTAPSRPAPPGP